MTALRALDRELIELAGAEIRRLYRKDWHEVGAAVRTRSGRVFAAVNIDAFVPVCAEAAAISRAVAEGDERLETIVAVKYLPGRDAFRVVSPCGICRELIADFGKVEVIHADGSRLIRSPIDDLLPQRYESEGARRRWRGRESSR